MSITNHIRDNWYRFLWELFPEVQDAVGPLLKKYQRFVMALEIASPENFIFWISQKDGRPLCDCVNLVRAFIAKAHWDIPTTTHVPHFPANPRQKWAVLLIPDC